MRQIEVSKPAKVAEGKPSINNELEESQKPAEAETHGDVQNGSEVAQNAEETATNQQKTEETETEVKVTEEPKVEPEITSEPEQSKNVGKKHVVRYLGNGAWTDKDGKIWIKNSSNPNVISSISLTDEEYVLRTDIHFMVSYGAMEHIEV